MDKYLMSLPTQLLQMFVSTDHASRQGLDDQANHVPAPASPSYENDDYALALPDFSYGHTPALRDAHEVESRDTPFVRGHLKHFSVDGFLQAPFALGNAPRHAFQHLRNVSLDDHNYRPQFVTPAQRRGHAHLASLTSNLADPPSGTFLHLVLTLTFALADLALSNKLLLESPYSSYGAATTPGRRKMLTSLSLQNLYTTPLRGNLAPSPSMKVSKLLVSHRRNRLRASAEPGLALLLTLIANMKTAHAQFHPHTHTAAQNPFETVGVSPNMGHVTDFDDASLATPASTGTALMYFTPIAHSRHFGGSLNEPGSGLANYPPLPRMHEPHQQQEFLFRQANLGMNVQSGSFEHLGNGDDTDTDAPFSPHPDLMLSRSHSMRNLRPGQYSQLPHMASEPPMRSFRHVAPQIDLLLPEMGSPARSGNSALRSYPASIDLAAITKLGMAHLELPLATSPQRLLPPLPSARSTSSIPTLNSARSLRGMKSNLHELLLNQNLAIKPTPSYPSPSQIHETSTTDEIAKFAEHILNLDMKRPIVMHDEQAEPDDPKKKHKCPLCFAPFQRPEHVKRHLKSHTSEKPFQCDMPDCGRRFNRKDNLKAHMKKIHGQSM